MQKMYSSPLFPLEFYTSLPEICHKNTGKQGFLS